MNWSLRQLAAGAQTLRLFTALVCSLAVTSAVAGPMAWQALEYRRDEAALVALAPSSNPSDASSAATERVASGSGSGSGGAGTATTPSGPTSSAPTTAAVATTPAASAAGGSAASSTTTGSRALGAQVSVPGGPVSNLSPPPASAPIVADEPITPGPTVTVPGPGTTTPATDPTVTQPPTTTATTADLLDEFNPRPPCDDAAYELRVDAVPDCEPIRP